MLYLVLLLVLAAFGLLIAALTTANTLWAWLSVVVSVVAAVLLVSDWLRGRRVVTRVRPPVAAGGDTADGAEPDNGVDELDDEPEFEPADHAPGGWPSSADDRDSRLDLGHDLDERRAAADSEVAERQAFGDSVHIGPDGDDDVDPRERTIALRHPPRDAARSDPARLDPAREPDEEDTDAADLLVVSGLGVEVRVLDERPRYHLSRCAWLAARPSIPLPLSEARQLGFTPCGVCTPDAVVSARHRAGRGARQPRS